MNDDQTEYNAKHILGSSAYFMLNKNLLSKIKDIKVCLLFAYLIEQSEWGEYFPLPSKKIGEGTTLSYSEQKRCLGILESKGFIQSKLMGLPRTSYYLILKFN